MSANPFRAFIPYTVNSNAVRTGVVQASFQAQDPSGGQWRAIGLAPAFKGEPLLIDMEGAATLMAVQFNERILPSKVRDEVLAKRVKALADQTGRAVNKKEYAQLRDEVEFELLPKAFIRRTLVLVFFIKQYMLVCTSSQKRADDAVAVLTGAFGEALAPWKISTARTVVGTLTTLAKDGVSIDGEDESFTESDCAVLKGGAKKTIRIKDKDIGEHDVQTLLKQEYQVFELGLKFHTLADEGDEGCTLAFVVNDNLAFKRLTLPGVVATRHKEDLFGFALICVKTYREMLDSFIKVCGGLAVKSDEIDDEDEL